MPKISVIIPVYNTEKYLPKCLDSVINQTLKDIEIICINDCSTDGSLPVLYEYAKEDKRIKIINLAQNHGVSYARNAGIEEASGDYTAFLDPDDWWEIDLVEKVYDKIAADNPEIIQFGHNRLINWKLNQYEIINKIEEVINGKNYCEYFCDFVNLVWDKVYKTTFLKNNNIKFPLDIHPTEDVLFVLECFSYKPNIIFIPECLYNYRINREGSAMSNYDKLVTNQIKAANIMFGSDFYKNSDDNFKKQCIKKIIGGLLYFCALTIEKKYPMKIYISQLRKFVLFLQKEIPQELIVSCRDFENLERFALLSNTNSKK